MAEDNENETIQEEDATSQYEEQAKESSEGRTNLIKSLFNGSNKLLTLANSDVISIDDSTRRLLALFSDGRFLVVETHKFDGRVMSFQVLAKRKGLRFGKPIFVTQNELNAIYTYGERSAPLDLSEKEVEDLIKSFQK